MIDSDFFLKVRESSADISGLHVLLLLRRVPVRVDANPLYRQVSRFTWPDCGPGGKSPTNPSFWNITRFIPLKAHTPPL